MTLISNFSLTVMLTALFFAVLHPKIHLPCWYDILIWAFIIGGIAMLINNNQYVHDIDAEILLRFAGSWLVVGAVYEKYRRSVASAKRKSEGANN